MNYPKTWLTLAEALKGKGKFSREDRFWSRVDKSGECWTWSAARFTTGYGAVWQDGKVQKAHRLAWAYANGPIPAGVRVLHHCDNPPCCRPDHLFLGTMSDNSRDRDAKGRGPKGVEKRLTDENVRLIRRLRAQGITLTRVGEIVGCHWVTVSNIANRKSRANVPDVPEEAAS